MPSLFGTDVAVNPQLRDVSRSFNATGPDGALRRTFDVLAERATPIMISATYTSGTEIKVFIEGDFPDDDYDGDGSDESFASYLAAQISALGVVDSIDLDGTTVSEVGGSPYFADDVEADY
jgi:hypothetical protein